MAHYRKIFFIMYAGIWFTNTVTWNAKLVSTASIWILICCQKLSQKRSSPFQKVKGSSNLLLILSFASLAWSNRLLTFCITDNVLVKGAFEEVMNLIISQDLPRVGCDEHYEKFVCNSIYDYLLLRFKAIAKRKKQEKFEANNAKHHANRKMSKI